MAKPKNIKTSITPKLEKSKLTLITDLLTNSIGTKLNKFIIDKKSKVISSIEASSPSVFLLKWAINNWVTILLSIVLITFTIKYYLSQEELREVQLKSEIASLQLDLDKMKKEREIFLERIKELQSIKKGNIEKTKKVKESATKLDSEGKKALLLEYKTRLLLKRRL